MLPLVGGFAISSDGYFFHFGAIDACNVIDKLKQNFFVNLSSANITFRLEKFQFQH